MSIEVVGVEATIAMIGNDLDAFALDVDAIIQETGLECQDYATAAVPVDTGALQESIMCIPGFLECEVSTDSDYAVYVEMGTMYNVPQSFMLPAFDFAKEYLLDEIGDL